MRGWLFKEGDPVCIWEIRMTFVCPDCGAVDTGNGTCREIFDSFLALEFSDPVYGEVHMLTVGTYMIQHYRYTDAALVWICQNMRAFMKGTRTVQEVRDDLNRLECDNGGKRRILRSPKDSPKSRSVWSMTIDAVAEAYDSPERYCELVRGWADLTLTQLNW